ncbi:arylesterase [Methylotenera sp. G11]|uniref:arylesterase n=1 Tax=Methylotenera sp. G11 TaxID=1506585 RepID=UPI001F1F6AEA|nr:arylesterase [Methylotenera sp. G11]
MKNSIVSLCLISFVAWATPAFAANPSILIYGDSLSAAYGIPQQQGWVALLKEKLHRENPGIDVINASISGETTSGGLTRLARTLAQNKPQTIIIELGANDGLRGLPVKNMRENLDAMIQLSKKSGARVLLVGMKIPPNYGRQYTQEFSQVYTALASRHNIPVVPFMLENIAVKPQLIQADGLHPNALGQPIILENIWPELQRLLKKSSR